MVTGHGSETVWSKIFESTIVGVSTVIVEVVYVIITCVVPTLSGAETVHAFVFPASVDICD